MSYQSDYSDGRKNLKIQTRRTPKETPERITEKDFDKLKAEYVEKYGYYVKIPQLGDIFHWKPNAFKTPEEIKQEKRDALMRMLASPATKEYQWYSSIMTWLDNIDDATSIVYPAIRMLWRAFPKVITKILPLVGWVMLATDLLNLVIGLGRAPFNPMGGKRHLCQMLKQNPFAKKAQFERIDRLKFGKPGLRDLLQVLQTTDMITGVGLSLGALMGLLTDSISGASRYISGQKVTWGYDIPDLWKHEFAASKGIKYATYISSFGQLFSEPRHLMAYATWAASATILAPYVRDANLTEQIPDHWNIVAPADRPTDPITLEVIKEAGLNVEDGVGWPFNGQKEITLGELEEHITPRAREAFRDYTFRHAHDTQGLAAATLLDQTIVPTIKAYDPAAEVKFEDPPVNKVAYRMIKSGTMPTEYLTKEQGQTLVDWIEAFYNQYGDAPGLMALQDKFDGMGIKYQTTYPPGFKDNSPEWVRGMELLGPPPETTDF